MTKQKSKEETFTLAQPYENKTPSEFVKQNAIDIKAKMIKYNVLSQGTNALKRELNQLRILPL
jgi:hypothetical protein